VVGLVEKRRLSPVWHDRLIVQRVVKRESFARARDVSVGGPAPAGECLVQPPVAMPPIASVLNIGPSVKRSNESLSFGGSDGMERLLRRGSRKERR